MKAKYIADVSVVSFSISLVLLFYSCLGWSVASEGFGSFSFLFVPAIMLLVFSFITQYVAIKKFKHDAPEFSREV